MDNCLRNDISLVKKSLEPFLRYSAKTFKTFYFLSMATHQNDDEVIALK